MLGQSMRVDSASCAYSENDSTETLDPQASTMQLANCKGWTLGAGFLND